MSNNNNDDNTDNIILYECIECYALVEYQGQPHHCPGTDVEDDEGFEDHLDILFEEINSKEKQYTIK